MQPVIEQAEAAQQRANAYARAGDHRAAVDAGADAERLLRTVPAGDENVLTVLSSALTDLSRHLSRLGEHERAVTKATEAVEIRRRVFAGDLEVGRLYLNSVNNLAIALSGCGRHQQALEMTLEAVTAARELHALGMIDDGLLAFLLHTLCNRFASLNRSGPAREASSEAVQLFRQAAEQDPERYDPELAMALRNASEDMWNDGDQPGALELCREAVDICRRLAGQSPERYTESLVTSLQKIARQLSELDRDDEACVFLREAVTRLEPGDGPLTAQRADDLARSLLDLGGTYLGCERWADAAHASERSVTLFRRLAQHGHPQPRDLAGALSNQATAWYALSRPALALPAALEAWTIRRTLADAVRDADAYLQVALAAHNASVPLAATGRLDDALAAAEASIVAYGRAGEPVPEHVHANRASIAGLVHDHRDVSRA